MRKIRNKYKQYTANVSNAQHQKTDIKQNMFRISAKRILLTYSQVHPDMQPTDLLGLLEKSLYLSRFDYIIAKEQHHNPDSTDLQNNSYICTQKSTLNEKGIHYHVILIGQKKFEIKSQKGLDIEFKGNTYHGNYQPVKDLTHTIEYVCKHKMYISSLTNLQDGKILDDKDFLLQRAKTVGFEEALIDYSVKYPKKALTSIKNLKNNFQEIQNLHKSSKGDLLETPFTVENFHLEGNLKRWTLYPSLYALFLIGKSGIGKTQFAKAFCKEKKWKTLLVSHKEDFQRINTSYDAVIIDDANFNEFSDSQKLALIDNSVEKTIRVMYQTVTKKKDVVMMILMNHQPFREVYKLFQQEAYSRRVIIHNPKAPFIVNLNFNPTYNINHYYGNAQNNHYSAFEHHVKQEKQLIKDNQKAANEIYTSEIA